MCFVKKGQRTVGSWSKQALGLLPYVKQFACTLRKAIALHSVDGFLDIQQDIDRINTQQENVTTAMKDIQDVKDILVRIQHKQFEFSTDLENLRTNQTDMLVRVAFTATRTQSQSFTTETTLVFSNALTNIGGGYRL
uniref:Uncharacterized protein n=1 Tax=Magallana gigas TaxID=29159 RepID=K1RFI7_MAGGI